MSFYKKDFHLDCLADELKHWIIYIHSSIAEPSSVVNTSVYRGDDFTAVLVLQTIVQRHQKKAKSGRGPIAQIIKVPSVKEKICSTNRESMVIRDPRNETLND